MIRNYFKIAWRNLLGNKKTSAINVIGLAIGIAVAILISLWVYDELSFNKNFKNYDRIAQVMQNVTNNGEVQTWNNVPYPLAQELRKNYGSDFKQVIMAGNLGDHIVSYKDKKIKQNGGYFEQGVADMLSLTMLSGTGKLDNPAAVLLSASAAAANFGEEDAIGKMVQLGNTPPVRVSGVYKDLPANSSFKGLDFIATWEFNYANSNGFKGMDDPWRPNFVSLFVQLNDNVDLAAASLKIRDAKLKNVNAQLQQKKPALFLHPMSKWHLESTFKNGVNTGGEIQYVWMFATIGIFVLLLACINFINLSTARSEKRAKEVGIRKTVGSVRSQLIAQFFSESLLTVFIAFVCAIVLVWLAFPFLNEIAGKQMSILWNNYFFWLVCLAFIVFTAVVAGSYPAFYLSSFKPVKVLKGTFKGGRFSALPRKVLVVLQFTISVALIIGTIVVYRQIDFAKDRATGYSKDNLVSIPTWNPLIHKNFNAVKDDLLKSGAIVSIAESESPTTDIWNTSSGISWPGKDPNLSTDFGIVNASYDFGKTIGWTMKEGRDFSRDFATDSAAVILNEAAVKYMGLKNAVGTTISSWGEPLKVIGVINDMVIRSPYSEVPPVVYCLSSGNGNLALLKLNPALGTAAALGKVEAVFKKFNTEQPFEYRFVDEEYAKKFGNEERVSKLANIFTILAVLISCLGLFGLTSFVVEQRRKEIGVRKVLGASVFNIWNLLSKDFVMLVAISFLVAVPLSYYFMNGWLQNYSYRTNLAWWIFTAAGLGALVITVLVVSAQAIRASLTNPVKSLRTE